MIRSNVVVVGAGIVGLATARALTRMAPGLDVIVLDKEDGPARHQSGRNSGVVHSGVYYAPGSAKATLVGSGRRELVAYCTDRGLPLRRLGKVVVATRSAELEPLADLARRAAANGVEAHRVGPAGLADLEPHAAGIAALHVPDVYVCDFAAVAGAFAEDVVEAGGALLTGIEVVGIRAGSDGVVVTAADGRSIAARALINCAGLHADRVAELAGADPTVRILPFRGEYHRLAESRAALVRGLIYPVPDPRFPFLGVHLTRMIDGGVHVGPNAVPALAREGYSWGAVDGAHLRGLGADPAVRRLARRYWRTGAEEIARSLSTRRFAAAAARLVPGVEVGDLEPDRAGVRAQALAGDGTLVDDFVFVDGQRSVHVLNAPSPAATAAPAIGAEVARRAMAVLR